jgi:hypothetical protein
MFRSESISLFLPHNLSADTLRTTSPNPRQPDTLKIASNRYHRKGLGASGLDDVDKESQEHELAVQD